MEMAADDERVRKALQKRPQARTSGDIQRLIERTEDVPLLVHNGAAMHSDLCHVLKLKVLRDSEALKVGPGNGGESLYMVISGKLRISCPDIAPLEPILELGAIMDEKGGKKKKKKVFNNEPCDD
eukprot:evm.model.scf_25EXC.10 EVM.evm.TU.scf_25EXC.10   scf_25EXC:197229-199077(-)